MAALPKEKKEKITTVPYDSEESKKLLEGAAKDGYYMESMDKVHQFQEHGTVCGLISLLIGLNGKQVANDGNNKNLKSEKWILENYDKYCKKTDKKVILRDGLFLQQASQIATEFGCKDVQTVHCNQIKQDDISKAQESFRQTCKAIFKQSNESKNDKFIVCNFDCSHFGAQFGHLSPIAGYNEKSDFILVLDTWKPFGKYWIKLAHLWNQMNTIDNDSKQYRGYYFATLPLLSNS